MSIVITIHSIQDILCSYIEQVISGRGICIHVVYYNMEPLTEEPYVFSGSEGGRCGLEGGVEDCLRALAKAGNGRFHHFRVSGSCDSDDISELRTEMAQAFEYLEEGRRILQDYREFCRRVCTATMNSL